MSALNRKIREVLARDLPQSRKAAQLERLVKDRMAYALESAADAVDMAAVNVDIFDSPAERGLWRELNWQRHEAAESLRARAERVRGASND